MNSPTGDSTSQRPAHIVRSPFLRNCVTNLRRKYLWLFAAYSALAFTYSVITPPLRAPDERNHFLRAYEISEFHFCAHRLADGFVGDDLPASLAQFSDAVGNHTNNRMTAEQLAAARAVQLQPDRRVPIEFSNSALYAPGVYLPAAIAIACGRLLGLSPFVLLFGARTANLLVASALITLAISHARYARWPVTLTALLPMAVSQMALVTTDAMTFAVIFAWTALVANIAIGRQKRLARTERLLLVGGALLLSQLRPPYPMVVLLIFAVPIQRFGTRKMGAAFCAIALLVTAVPAIAWNLSARPLFVPEPHMSTVSAQIDLLREHPMHFIGAVKEDLAKRGAEHWSQAVGRFGWLNVWLPAWVPVGYALALFASSFIGVRDAILPQWWQRGLFAAIAVGTLLGVQLILYISYDLGWIQGRYFIPTILLVAFACANAMLARQRAGMMVRMACLLFAIAAHIASLFALAHARGLV